MSVMDRRWQRETLGRSDSDPTDSGAEVQVLKPIAPNLIRSLVVEPATAQRAVDTTKARLGVTEPVIVMLEWFQ